MSLGLFLYRYRSYTPLPLLAIGIIFGHPSASSITAGIAVGMLGEAVRVWGVAVAGPLTRMTTQPGGEQLATNGPYAYVRNPLYLGNIILYTGVGIMTNIWWIALLAWMYFQFQYSLIIRTEENYLREHFGERYKSYLENVHRIIPRFTPYRVQQNFSPAPNTKEAFRSERRTFQAIAIATIIMCVVAYFKN